MTSILVKILGISRNKFKCNYLKHEKRVSLFFITFQKSTSSSELFAKKDQSHSLTIFEVIDSGIGGNLNV